MPEWLKEFLEPDGGFLFGIILDLILNGGKAADRGQPADRRHGLGRMVIGLILGPEVPTDTGKNEDQKYPPEPGGVAAFLDGGRGFH